MKLTEAQIRDYAERLAHLDAVVKLAGANFPRATGLRIETEGCSPKASINVSSHFLRFALEAGRAALEASR